MKGQWLTWYQHAAIAALIPALGVSFTGSLAAALPLAIATFAVFWVRELRDERRHKDAGDWTTPEASTGVTPESDMRGDMVGPWSVLLCYFLLTVAILAL